MINSNVHAGGMIGQRMTIQAILFLNVHYLHTRSIYGTIRTRLRIKFQILVDTITWNSLNRP